MADLNVIVLDTGGDSVRAGYCYPDRDPMLVTPTAVRLAGGGDDSPVLRPVQRGCVTDWDALESIYHHVFYDQLGWTVGDEGAVLVVEPLFTPKADRERLVQLLFEQFNVAGVYVADAAVLSLYAVGKLSGLAVDVGAGKVDICPVFEGSAMTHAGRRLAFGGADVDEHLAAMLRSSGINVDAATARSIKEKHGVVCESGEAFEQCCRQGPSDEAWTAWELPGGTSCSLPPSILARAGELWFDPTGRPGAGLGDEVLASVGLCGHDFRRQLLENVVLTGGGSATTGLEARLTRELTEGAASTVRPGTVPLPEYMPPNTMRHAAFMGATIVAKTVFPTHQHISKRDYHEKGPNTAMRL